MIRRTSLFQFQMIMEIAMSKHTFIGNTLEGLTDMEINVLQVALTHLIEELEDTEEDRQLETSKQLYLDLGGKEFWK